MLLRGALFCALAAASSEPRALAPAAPGRALARSRALLLRGGAADRKERPAAASKSQGALAGACAKLVNNHVRGIIFGGLDGILTTFAIMAASIGAHQTAATTLVLGISTLLADALSMAGGEYLSSKAEREALSERGLRRAQLEPPPLARAAAIFSAFIVFGSVPLLGFIGSHAIARVHPQMQHGLFSCGVTTVALFLLGAIKSQFGKGPWWKSGGEVVFVGGLAAGSAYWSAVLADRIVTSMSS